MLIALSIIVAIILLYLVGPRPKVVEHIKVPALPEDLDHYLLVSEKQHSNIVPETEKKIYWFDTPKKQTEIALIYLHGFTATRQETSPLAEILAQKLKANLYYTRLKAHGQDSEAFASVTANDWLNDAAETLAIGEKLGKKVVVIGTSTGATLGMWLAMRFPKNIAALVLLSPNFKPRGPAGILAGPWGLWLAKLLIGTHRSSPVRSNVDLSIYWTRKQRVEGVVELMALMKHFRAQDLSQIKTPTFMAYVEEDLVVDIEETKQGFAKLQNSRNKLHRVHESKLHVLAGRLVSPEATEPLAREILKFLEFLS